MPVVATPAEMNPAFARAFNSRDIENFMALYEPDAVLRSDASGQEQRGLAEIRAALEKLLLAPGKMTSVNNFSITVGEIALLRADWKLEHDGHVIASGSSAEIVRRQKDGGWLYVADHALGASLPAVTGA